MQHQAPRGRRVGAAALTACALATGAVAASATAQTAGPSVSMAVDSDDRRVRYAERVEVSGAVSPAAPGREVELQYAPEGRDYETVAETTTDDAGRYEVAARPRQNGRLRAVVDGSQASSPAVVRVAARPIATTRRHVRAGRVAVVRGRVLAGESGRTVHVQLRQGRRWTTVDRARTRTGGRFAAAWRQRSVGSYRVRVVFRGDRLNAPAARRARGTLNVYRPGHASWYGPGLYGNRTACGQTLTAGTVGVAHKRLRCGTRVTFRYRGRTVTLRVIDRGPFVAGREWDLTYAAKRRLGFGSTGTVWTTR